MVSTYYEEMHTEHSSNSKFRKSQLRLTCAFTTELNVWSLFILSISALFSATDTLRLAILSSSPYKDFFAPNKTKKTNRRQHLNSLSYQPEQDSHPRDGWPDPLTTPHLCSRRLGPACCLSPGVEEPVLEVRIVHQPQLVHVFLLPRDLPAPHNGRPLQVSCLRPLRLWWPPCRRQLRR